MIKKFYIKSVKSVYEAHVSDSDFGYRLFFFCVPCSYTHKDIVNRVHEITNYENTPIYKVKIERLYEHSIPWINGEHHRQTIQFGKDNDLDFFIISQKFLIPNPRPSDHYIYCLYTI